MLRVKHLGGEKQGDYKVSVFLHIFGKIMKIGKYVISASACKVKKGTVIVGFLFQNQIFYKHCWTLTIYLFFMEILIAVLDVQMPPTRMS